MLKGRGNNKWPRLPSRTIAFVAISSLIITSFQNCGPAGTPVDTSVSNSSTGGTDNPSSENPPGNNPPPPANNDLCLNNKAPHLATIPADQLIVNQSEIKVGMGTDAGSDPTRELLVDIHVYDNDGNKALNDLDCNFASNTQGLNNGSVNLNCNINLQSRQDVPGQNYDLYKGRIRISADNDAECISGKGTITVRVEDQCQALSNARSFQVEFVNTCLPTSKVPTAAQSPSEKMGSRVALSPSFGVISAPGDVTGGTQSGAAYVFQRGSTANAQKIVPQGAGARDELFGVGITDSWLVLGSPYRKYTAASRTYDQGIISIYQRANNTWTLFQQIRPPEAQSNLGRAGSVGFVDPDKFGYSVAISGTTIVVGAMGDTSNGPDSGAAYVYVFNGSSWVLQQKLIPSGLSNFDEFGRSVSIDNNTVVVGAPRASDRVSSRAARAYVFTRSGSAWSLSKTLEASNRSQTADASGLGTDVDVSGSLVVVGAPGVTVDNDAQAGRVYIYNLATLGSAAVVTETRAIDLGQQSLAKNFFGSSVAVSGSSIVVGAPNVPSAQEESGNVYYYLFDGSNATRIWRVQPRAADRAGGDQFGIAVDIQGGFLLSGASLHDGKAFAGGATFLIDLP